jgi:REP element-mobilizing transposase RayT
MLEHVHLLVSEPQDASDSKSPLKPKAGLSGPPVGLNGPPVLGGPPQYTLADALKSLKQGVSRRLIGDAEHFWQKRYYDFQHSELSAVCGKAALHSSQSGEGWVVRTS